MGLLFSLSLRVFFYVYIKFENVKTMCGKITTTSGNMPGISFVERKRKIWSSRI